MADIFISYKSEDRAAVEALVRMIETEGFDVWWDRTIVPGERFGQVIRQALDKAPCVLVAWSRNSVNSHWVQDEASLGRDRGVLVPVSLDGTDPPLGFRQLHTVDLANWHGQSDDPRLQHLLAGIRRLVGHPGKGREGPAPAHATEIAEARNTGHVVARNFAGKADADAAGKSKIRKFSYRWLALSALLLAVALGSAAYWATTYYPHATSPNDRFPGSAVPVERSFTDCKVGCPAMIVVPTGSFVMGSQDREPQRGNDEGPQHKVTISKVFAAGKFSVTFEEWDFCHSHGGCSSLFPSDNNWGRGRRPVINVSWEDAQNYVAWLSKFTGEKYRLLTEAEWEYIARAGTNTPFWWGNGITTKQANYDGTQRYTDEPLGLYREQTLPVDAFRPNPWGFYQTSGNTWDWVEDCYHDSYAHAPTDGSAWTSDDCTRRVLRGGSWGSQPRNVRPAARWRQPIDTREPYYGFRIARECGRGCNF
jgi:formylglycine-generating enzyme required for sulfatase activity